MSSVAYRRKERRRISQTLRFLKIAFSGKVDRVGGEQLIKDARTAREKKIKAFKCCGVCENCPGGH